MNDRHDFKKHNKQIELSATSIHKMNNSVYHPLVVEDQIQYKNHSLQPSHGYVCREIMKDLSALLFLSEKQFFQHLKLQDCLSDSDSLKEKQKQRQEKTMQFRFRTLLSSCLQIFSREQYVSFTQGKSKKVQQSDKRPYWQRFKQIVLMIFKKISFANTSEERMIILNGWYLDTCKLLDICQIYGKVYKQTVTEIIRNTFAKGAELEAYQKDYKTVVQLAYERLMWLCEQLQAYSGINFLQIQKTNQAYRNYHNVQSTIMKSLAKTLFTVYDLINNLSSILQFFPSRCKVQLLEYSLIFKRLIMIYNKIRHFNESQWRFGCRDSQFKPFIQEIQCKIINFMTYSMTKISMLIRQLPAQSPHRYNLKRTFINFWHFTLVVPALSYQFRQNNVRIRKGLYHGKQLGYLIMENSSIDLFSTPTLNHFNQNNKSFQSLTTAAKLNKQILANDGLKKIEQWKLPSFKQFILPLKQEQKRKQIDLKEYEDQPAKEQIQTFYVVQHSNCDLLESTNEQLDESSEIGQKSLQISTKSQKDKSQRLQYFQELQYSSIGLQSQHIFSGRFNESKVLESQSLNSSSELFFS